MNRNGKGLVIIMAMLLLLSLGIPSALAETVAFDQDQDTLKVSYDQCATGKEYVLIVYDGMTDGTKMDLDRIKFIDQIVCGSNGTICAAIVNPGVKEATVTLSGEFADGKTELRVIGTLGGGQKAIRFETGIEVIEEEAFYGCAFTHVYLNGKIRIIGARAFACCADLVYIDIPDSVEKIDPTAFEGSPNVVIGCHKKSVAYEFAVSNKIPYRLKDQ